MTSGSVPEFVAPDIGKFLQIVVRATRHFDDTRLWWRGHRKMDWPLATSLHRRGMGPKEANLNQRFRMSARVRRRDCPSSREPMAWLFLMQHYRLPTRLLDWTRSPLVALFFAVDGPDDSDSAVWALGPSRLNQLEAGRRAIFLSGTESVSQLAIEAFRTDIRSSDERILAVLTEQIDLRHMVQQSAFTIHGRSEPLDQIDGGDSALARIRIPVAAKPGFRQMLNLLGISRSSLFPDLENLALELAATDFELTKVLGPDRDKVAEQPSLKEGEEG